MSWIKHVIIDLLALVAIALATLADLEAARWVVIVYTPLMVVMKIIALAAGGLQIRSTRMKDAPPEWFFHAAYAVSILLLVIDRWWIMAAGWAVIWALSVAADRRAAARTRKKKVAR